MQPALPSGTGAVTNGAGVVAMTDVNNVAVTCALDKLSVGGSLRGLPSGAGVVLSNEGADNILLWASGSFILSALSADNSGYTVAL